jgi:hypothetical protein
VRVGVRHGPPWSQRNTDGSGHSFPHRDRRFMLTRRAVSSTRLDLSGLAGLPAPTAEWRIAVPPFAVACLLNCAFVLIRGRPASAKTDRLPSNSQQSLSRTVRAGGRGEPRSRPPGHYFACRWPSRPACSPGNLSGPLVTINVQLLVAVLGLGP